MVGPVLDLVEGDTLWVADRNFCFQSSLVGIAVKLGYFVIREHAGLNYEVAGE